MYIGGCILPLDLLALEEFLDGVLDNEHDFFFVGMRTSPMITRMLQ